MVIIAELRYEGKAITSRELKVVFQKPDDVKELPDLACIHVSMAMTTRAGTSGAPS